MAGPLRLIMFDFDGTLVDSQRPITEAMTQAFAAAGLAPPDPPMIRRVVGLPLEVAIGCLLPEALEPRVAELAETYRLTFARLRERPRGDRDPWPAERLPGNRDRQEPARPGGQPGAPRSFRLFHDAQDRR